MLRHERRKVAILGAGPIGLEAALYAASLQLPFTLYEAGATGYHVKQWGHVRLFSSFGMNTTALGRKLLREAAGASDQLPANDDVLTGREFAALYLDPLAASDLIAPHLQAQTRVLQVGRRGLLKHQIEAKRSEQPFRLLLRGSDNRDRMEEADIVLDCTGIYGQHRQLGDGGIFAAGELAVRGHIAWGLEDILGEKRGHYADKTTLVIGAGYSAATTVCNLATLAEKHPATWVIWLARTAGMQPIRRIVNDPLKERDRLAVRANSLATRADGCVEFHAPVAIESIECAGPDGPFTLHGRRDSKPLQWQADRVIANVGYTPDDRLYRELQIQECHMTLAPKGIADSLSKHAGSDCLSMPSQNIASLRTAEPNFYILGSKSYGRNSAFLLKAGFEQIRAVFAEIMGKPDLNLYAPSS